jgi:hypothetical protein
MGNGMLNVFISNGWWCNLADEFPATSMVDIIFGPRIVIGGSGRMPRMDGIHFLNDSIRYS